jgi:hypothetical protein
MATASGSALASSTVTAAFVPSAGNRAVAQFTYEPPETATGVSDVAAGGLVAVPVGVSSDSTAWVEESPAAEVEVVVAVAPE